MLHTWAKAGGKQKIENTGALTIERMRTVDEEFLDASLKFIDKAVEDDKPFFVCWNSTRMHLHPPEGGVARQDRTGHLPDGMVEHDGHVGQLLDELGIADNTIVMY